MENGKTTFEKVGIIFEMQWEIQTFEIREGGGRGGVIRDSEIKGGPVSKNFFSALRASVWSKDKGGPGPRAPPLDPPLRCFRIRLVSSTFSFII